MSRHYIVCIIMLLFIGISGAGATEPVDDDLNTSEKFVASPLSPAFISYLENQEVAGDEQQTLEHGLGAIPSPFYRPELTDAEMDILSIQEFNSTFDLRDEDKVTPVRDQGNFGTCWAHGSLASLESYLLPEENRSFSPKNMVNLHGFDNGVNDGGQIYMATAYLTRWNGPVDEATDPYPEENWTLSEVYPPQYHVQDVVIYPTRTDRNDTASIKAGLMEWGTASVGFYWNSSFYNPASFAYYQPETAENQKPGGGHIVSLAGWNDTYPASAFMNTPPGDGAWIVKNSWGTGFGDEGFFYVSYFDKYFGSVTKTGDLNYETAFVTGEPVDNYDQVYSYDPLGECNEYYIGYPKTGTVASRYKATETGKISAIGFFTTDVSTHYNATIYRHADDGPVGTKAAEIEGNLSFIGYHTVSLPTGEEVPVENGEFFSIVLYLENEENNYPVAMEYPINGYSSNATANPEETYYYDIDLESFIDLTHFNPNMSACLKAYSISEPVPTPTPTPEPLSASFTAKPVKGKAPLTVAFTDTSSGDPTNRIWSFGSGSQSMLQNPEITYTEPGQYTVSLLVQKGKEVDKETKYHLITVQEGSSAEEQ
ncbi:lectin like domain-containing protein [Methanospirillum stamsii]|nr:lectin like domain-containing protein [Methanospirillum stamsii]